MEILKLTLKSSKIDETRDFYHEKLGFKINYLNANMLSLQVGKTDLVFEKELDNCKANYHFAFLLPKNKLDEALIWLESKISVIKNESGAIVQFPNWNASSVYFHDNNGNILEFICRNDMDNDSTYNFSTESILSINEVGLAHESPLFLANSLISEIGTEYFSKGPVSEEFVALGDECGMFVISGLNRNWFPTNQLAQNHPINVSVKEKGIEYKLDF
ncbi:VOC family protein [Algoriphagus sp. AK58]|uniref:VOC family protein n=1 Tax=Algoriphagus sp. AK58 TaxID=1406877 RepID=UPI00164F3981|nr:hypothetical protein [Algoriphagus sp. AK58]MBC6366821.1 hypothetical protein [Algoriphagus sp. AK58]